MTSQALQFAGSLLAILVLAWLVKRLGMGRAPKLIDDDHVRSVAAEVLDGFDATAVARDAQGNGALASNASGQIMLIKAHGVHFAGRILSSQASATLDRGTILVRSGERRFGDVSLEIADGLAWVEAINALED